jgi:hypothetical protein
MFAERSEINVCPNEILNNWCRKQKMVSVKKESIKKKSKGSYKGNHW